MAYVQPNSVIQLFKGINLDNRYLHTIYFASESAQNSWFTSKVFKTYQGHSYQRYGVNTVKIKDEATTLLGCTYMRFMNDRSVDKWFYAFILGIEYVNENTALVTYEIDVMQTWFIQVGSIRPCMVKREHVNNDTFGENLEPEPIGSDVYEYDLITDANQISNNSSSSANDAFTNYSIMVNTTGKPNQTEFNVPNYYRQGLFNGTKFTFAECNRTTEANDFATNVMTAFLGDWTEHNEKEDVIDMSTVPTLFAKDLGGMDDPYNLEVNVPENLGGYVPKNKKLLTYPFTYLFGTTHNGDGGIFRWELFTINQALTYKYVKFHLMGCAHNGAQIMCYPYQYDGVDENYHNALYMTDFPKNSFAYDAYQAWLASGGNTRLLTDEKFLNMRGTANIISSGANLANAGVQAYTNAQAVLNGVSPTTGRRVTRSQNAQISAIAQDVNNVVQAGTSLANTVIDFEEAKNKIRYEWNDAYYRPNEIVGRSVPNLMVASRKLNFYFYNVYVKQSELTRLDDFLSCYGYAIDKVKAPNLTGRQYFNFVQTENAIIDGDMPSSSKEAIGRIFDGGITFWHNGDQVGNYMQSVSSGSINNPIV